MIFENLTNSTAYHDSSDNTIKMSKKDITTFGKLLNVFLHETQHNEQVIISENNTSYKISENYKELYNINRQGYIDISPNNRGILQKVMYEGQLLENEAYKVMRAEEIIKNVIENMINSF